MTEQIRGKSIIITGGSKGMGRAFVERLVAAGANVACLARKSSELEALRARPEANLLALDCDVSRSEEVNAAVAATAGRFGGIDVLVNNAAVFFPFLLENAKNEDVERHIAINVLGPIWCIRAATPHLRKSRGQIISISSESVRNPFPYLSVYAASKGALEVLSAGMREELREAGIRVTVLRSGAVAGSSGGAASWDPVMAREFFTTIQRTGHAAMAGVPASQASMTDALCTLLSLPADVNIDLLEARGAAAGLVTDHVQSARDIDAG